jgi:hypothetical protein
LASIISLTGEAFFSVAEATGSVPALVLVALDEHPVNASMHIAVAENVLRWVIMADFKIFIFELKIV